LKNIWRKKIQEKIKENVHYFSLGASIKLINQLISNRDLLKIDCLKMLIEMFGDGILKIEDQILLKEAFSIFLKDIPDPYL